MSATTYSFHGSYDPNDVEFLLKPICMPSIDREQKEIEIQSGKKHYSEMITYEEPASQEYLELFNAALLKTGPKFIADVYKLAKLISQYNPEPAELVLVSLARAGTPVGVLLKHILEQYLNRKVVHYSISIVRDFGLDKLAILEILNRGHRAEDVCFIDGWTGKGVISHTLKDSVTELNLEYSLNLSARLYVVTDISGTAAVAASADDYLIPTSILNSVVSGLISRTIRGVPQLSATDFHGCIYYRQFEHLDMSRSVIQTLLDMLKPQLPQLQKEHVYNVGGSELQQQKSQQLLNWVQQRYIIKSINYIKPGIGETTRVLLRRVPEVIFVQNKNAPEVQHILQLASERQVLVVEKPSLCYAALSIISDVSSNTEGS